MRRRCIPRLRIPLYCTSVVDDLAREDQVRVADAVDPGDAPPRAGEQTAQGVTRLHHVGPGTASRARYAPRQRASSPVPVRRGLADLTAALNGLAPHRPRGRVHALRLIHMCGWRRLISVVADRPPVALRGLCDSPTLRHGLRGLRDSPAIRIRRVSAGGGDSQRDGR